MRTYELMFIARPDLDEEGLTSLMERVQQVIADNGGEVSEMRNLGRKSLAYPLQKNVEGYYVLTYAGMERNTIAELERWLKLSDDVLRHMLLRRDEMA